MEEMKQEDSSAKDNAFVDVKHGSISEAVQGENENLQSAIASEQASMKPVPMENPQEITETSNGSGTGMETTSFLPEKVIVLQTGSCIDQENKMEEINKGDVATNSDKNHSVDSQHGESVASNDVSAEGECRNLEPTGHNLLGSEQQDLEKQELSSKESLSSPTEEEAVVSEASRNEIQICTMDEKEIKASASPAEQVVTPKAVDLTSGVEMEMDTVNDARVIIPDGNNEAMDIVEPMGAEHRAVTVQEEIAEQQQLESAAVQKINSSSLSLLCQYSGSSESESEEVSASQLSDGKKRNSPSSSSSDESDDDSAEESIQLPKIYREREGSVLASDAETQDTNAVSSDDDGDEDIQEPIRTKGEILIQELPPIEELTITVPEAECKAIGRIDSIVAQIVLVQSIAGMELLNIDTVLFLDRGNRPLGKIFDVIGQVNCPIYCVLFNSNQEVVAKNITVGLEVYCAPRTEHTSFIILSELMRYKGTDASWMNDNEPPSHVVEYSDDEAEKSAKKNRKKKTNAAGGPWQPENSAPPQHGTNPYTPRPQFRRPPPSNRQNVFTHQQNNYSWHHNVGNPRNNYPRQQQYYPQQQQYRQYQHSHQQQHHQQQQNQQQQQQIHQLPNPNAAPGTSFLPNPFAVFGTQSPNPPSDKTQ